MFQEYPKWIGLDENGNDVIVFSKEEESKHKAELPKAADVAESAPEPKKRGRPRKVVTDGNGSDKD